MTLNRATIFLRLAVTTFAVAAAGCSQLGVPATSGAASLNPVGPSVTAVTPAVSGALGGPGAGYNVTGTWHASIGPHHGPQFESDVVLVQDAAGKVIGMPVETGDIVGLVMDPHGGIGRVITYQLTLSSPTSCLLMTGTARLDTSTDTITANVQGTTDSCERVNGILTMHKVS